MSQDALQISCPRSQCEHSKMSELLKTHKKCNWIPLSGARVYQGAQGRVFQVCCQDDCEFMVKIQVPGAKKSSWMDQVKREIKIQNIVSEYGLAPKIVEGWLCDHESTIIIEKAQFNLLQYVKYLIVLGLSDEQISKRLDEVYTEMIEKVNMLHELGIAHGDLHLKNVVVDTIGNSPQWTNLRFIDFGKSKEYRTEDNEPDVRKARNNDNEPDDIKLSFKRYKSRMKDIRNGTFEDDDDREVKKQSATGFFSPDIFNSPHTPTTPQRPSSANQSPGSPDTPSVIKRLF